TEVPPWEAWDNLRNLDMGRVMNISYFQCQTTEDGVLPHPRDEVFGQPTEDRSYISILNGKFSMENQRMKTHQVKENSVTSRVQVRDHLYTVRAFPDFTLDARFTSQAEEIADAIENNQTRLAEYLSKKMVLDYCTHVITSVDSGAILVEEDYLKSSYVSNMQSSQSSVSASAGASFYKKVKVDIGGKMSEETSETQSYQGNITYSITLSQGGALFYPGITLQKWPRQCAINNMVGYRP
ncbi:hypothetical protein NFI96_029496, partial [Prochilodus magdalenae]